MFPRQASCCSAFCVSSGRRFNLPTIRSTTLSVYLFAWMRLRSQDHRRLLMIEREPPFFGERVKKLNQEERIAGRLLVHQLRERGGALRLAAKRIRNELSYVFTGERRKRDLLHVRSRVPDRFELAHQRMGRSDFVVPVGADQHQVLHVRLESADPRADRASPRRAIASRRGTSASGCSGRANTPMNRRNTSWKRRCASCGGRSGTGGWFSDDELAVRGRGSTMSCPFGPSASRRASRQAASSASLLPEELTDRGSERPAPGSHRGCRACTDRTCQTQTGRAAAPAPCAAH